MLQFDADVLRQIDERAAARGLKRAEIVRLMVAHALVCAKGPLVVSHRVAYTLGKDPEEGS